MRKTHLQIIRVLNQVYFHGKNITLFEIFLRPFYGQSFIKTVRGPLMSIKATIRTKIHSDVVMQTKNM